MITIIPRFKLKFYKNTTLEIIVSRHSARKLNTPVCYKRSQRQYSFLFKIKQVTMSLSLATLRKPVASPITALIASFIYSFRIYLHRFLCHQGNRLVRVHRSHPETAKISHLRGF